MHQRLLVMTVVLLSVASLALAAPPSEESAVVSTSSPENDCGNVIPSTVAEQLTGVLPLNQAIGGVGSTGCCYSDPCPGWGSQTVGCCENGCVAYSKGVCCPSTGCKVCPDPCAGNGICNEACTYDPDCEPPCDCFDGRLCGRDADCGCDGVCDPWLGTCFCLP